MRITENKIPMPSLAANLQARPGIPLTPEQLLKVRDKKTSKIAISWLGNDSILLSQPSQDEPNKDLLELLDLRTGERRLLCEGSSPVVSPNAKWIAFTKKVESEKQLFLMKADGSEIKA